jgi:hypothetical protein
VSEDGERAAVIRDVDRMIDLLNAPVPPAASIRSRLIDWAMERPKRRREWRQEWVEAFGDVRERLARGDSAFEAEAHHLARWMDWDGYLEGETPEIQLLASSIQRGLRKLIER